MVMQMKEARYATEYFGKEIIKEEDDKKSAEYQAFFKKMLKKFGVTEPDQLEGAKKKEFFDAVDAGWKADNEKVEEKFQLNEKVTIVKLNAGEPQDVNIQGMGKVRVYISQIKGKTANLHIDKLGA